jgi:hypothetical protein
MKHLLPAALFAATFAAALPTPATAQSDILLRLRSGSPLGDRFRVDSAGAWWPWAPWASASSPSAATARG